MSKTSRDHQSSQLRIKEELNMVDVPKDESSLPPQATSGDARTKSNRSKTPTVHVQRKRHTKFVDQAPKHRTAMGEYIVPEGGIPLTQNERFRPIGPGHYTQPRLNAYKNQAPEWSIQTRHPRKIKTTGPPPNHYLLPEGIILKGKFTFGQRLQPDKKAIAGACDRGPTYSVKGHETGRNGPKYSIPKGQRGQLNTGHPNRLVHPVDSIGFKTPAAEVFSMDGVRPHPFHARIVSRISPRKPTDGLPGPNNYWLTPLDPGHQKSFGLCLKQIQHSKDMPASNEYSLPSKLGDGPKYSIGLPHKPAKPPRAPSPCTYMKEREYSHKEIITMGYRPISPQTEQNPAPNAYNVSQKDKAQGFTLKDRVKVPFPACLHSAYADATKDRSPGPAAHTVKLSDNLDRGATIKGKYPLPGTGPRPGPSDYGRLDCGQLSTKPCPPAYTMRPYLKPLSAGWVPAPNAYRTVPVDPGLSTTMKSRHLITTRQSLPAPNTYIPKRKCTRFGPSSDLGITMKSRHSPWVYSGLKEHFNEEKAPSV